MKVLVTFSGGKDSLAALLWTREHITRNFTTVFCDTGWEHPLTYDYIHRTADRLHLDLVTLRSKKYDGISARIYNGRKSTETAQISKTPTTLTTFTTMLIKRELYKISDVVFTNRKTTLNYKIGQLPE